MVIVPARCEKYCEVHAPDGAVALLADLGLRALAAQTALDLAVLTAIYLPTFYVFKAAVFSGSADTV